MINCTFNNTPSSLYTLLIGQVVESTVMKHSIRRLSLYLSISILSCIHQMVILVNVPVKHLRWFDLNNCWKPEDNEL